MKRRPILWGFIISLIVLALVYLVVKGANQATRKAPSSSAIFRGEAIGVLEIEGLIVTAKKWLESIKEFEENSEVKAIVLRIDSPGGSVGTAQEVYREINRLKLSKPVVASIENIGASAAYYIASASNKIVLNPGTLTGSIGVIYISFDMSRLYRWMKIEPEVIKSGKFKDTGSTFRSMTPEERNLLLNTIAQIHQQFVEDVAKARNLAVEKVNEIADGRLLTGEQAVQLGLADEFGNFNDAIDKAAQLAGIKGKPRIIYPKRKFEWRLLFESLSDAVVNKMFEIGSTPMYRYALDGRGSK